MGFAWNSVCVCRMTTVGVFLCAFCHSEFRVKCTQVKIMIAMLLQLLRCAIGPNALSRLSVARDTSSHSNCQLSTAHFCHKCANKSGVVPMSVCLPLSTLLIVCVAFHCKTSHKIPTVSMSVSAPVHNSHPHLPIESRKLIM